MIASKAIHRIDLNWRVKNANVVAIGETPRTILQVQAVRRELEVMSVRVDYPDFPEGATALAWICGQERAIGERKLWPEGEAVCFGREDLPARIPRDCFQPNVNTYPYDFWQFVGPCDRTYERMHIDRGQCVAVVVVCNMPARCKVSIGGR